MMAAKLFAIVTAHDAGISLVRYRSASPSIRNSSPHTYPIAPQPYCCIGRRGEETLVLLAQAGNGAI